MLPLTRMLLCGLLDKLLEFFQLALHVSVGIPIDLLELSGFPEFLLLGSIFFVLPAVICVVGLVWTSMLFTELTKLVRRLRFLRNTISGGIHTSTLVRFLRTSLGFQLRGLVGT